MAKLTPELFTEGKPLSHYSVHAPMEADYHVFHDGDSPILLIRTFSSTERKKEGKACQNINESELDELVFTDSIPFDKTKCPKVKIVSISDPIAETISAIQEHRSISELNIR